MSSLRWSAAEKLIAAICGECSAALSLISHNFACKAAIFRVFDQKGPLLALLLDSMNQSRPLILWLSEGSKSVVHHFCQPRFALIMGVVALSVARCTRVLNV